MSRLTALLLLFTITSLSACGPLQGEPIGDSPEADDYDRSCSQDSDCALVTLARACSCSGQGSVNASEVSSVEKDNDRELRYEDRCTSQADCSGPAPSEPVCEMGVCEARIIWEAAEDFLGACEQDSDCGVAELARSCDCKDDVAVDAAQHAEVDWHNDLRLRTLSCAMPETPCEASRSPEPEAYCENKTCALRAR